MEDGSASDKSNNNGQLQEIPVSPNPNGSTVSANDSLVILDTPSKRVGPTKRRMFEDENAPTFFRRLSFSPEGSLIFASSGLCSVYPNGSVVRPELSASGDGESVAPSSSESYCAWIFARGRLDSPVLSIPTSKTVVAVKPNPKLWKKTEDLKNPVFDLPYRIIYAVLTQDTLLLYDTERTHPIALATDVHYASLTDIAWIRDGSGLAITSLDGYVSFVLFQNGELGTPLDDSELQAAIVNVAQRDNFSRKRKSEGGKPGRKRPRIGSLLAALNAEASKATSNNNAVSKNVESGEDAEMSEAAVEEKPLPVVDVTRLEVEIMDME